jgi:hypothetical protein
MRSKRTFSEVTHTKDIDQTDQNAEYRGVERDMSLLKRLFTFSWTSRSDVTYIRVPE